MKKLSVIIFFLSLIMIGCTEKRIYYSELMEVGEIYYFQDKPFTGTAFVMHNKNQPMEVQTYKEGKPDGIWKQYYESGQLKSETPFKEGIPDKVIKQYYENGQLKSEVTYKDGQPDGQGKKYYENGQLESEETYKEGVRIK